MIIDHLMMTDALMDGWLMIRELTNDQEVYVMPNQMVNGQLVYYQLMDGQWSLNKCLEIRGLISWWLVYGSNDCLNAGYWWWVTNDQSTCLSVCD